MVCLNLMVCQLVWLPIDSDCGGTYENAAHQPNGDLPGCTVASIVAVLSEKEPPKVLGIGCSCLSDIEFPISATTFGKPGMVNPHRVEESRTN
jgi:hypothetical protein